MKTRYKWATRLVACLLLAALAAAMLAGCAPKEYTSATLAMDTMVTQTAYGKNAQEAMTQVNAALAAYENRLSLFKEGSDIAKINAAAGQDAAEVQPETAALLRQALALSAESGGVFAITIAPLTLLWGVTGSTPKVPAQAQIDALLPLVNDAAVQVEGNNVSLPVAGMAIDLGGIAKGAACGLAADIYAQHGVNSALLNIGGNVYARGAKPGGDEFRIGYRDPTRGEGAYIASFTMRDKVVAVSGGYERYFEENGKKYIHILDPRTGYPVESDILSVGVIHEDGAVADFYSTTLFIGGAESALQYMRGGGTAILLAADDMLYVSESLQDSFELYEHVADEYTLTFVAGG